jgi:hypothetical protein
MTKRAQPPGAGRYRRPASFESLRCSGIGLVEPACEFRVARQVLAVVLPGDVAHTSGEIRPRGLVARHPVAQHGRSHPRAESVVGHLAAGVSDQAELGRKPAASGESKDGRHDHPLGEIAGGAEEHDSARLDHRAGLWADIRLSPVGSCAARHRASPDRL